MRIHGIRGEEISKVVVVQSPGIPESSGDDIDGVLGGMESPDAADDSARRARSAVGGVLYATISVGSADNVNPRAQLNVVKGGNFVGFITIKTVDAHSAVGSVQGPNLGPNPASIDVLKGAEVRSQL